jgi:hypothetical protein
VTRRAAAALLLLVVLHTWPLATAPHALSRNDNGDCQLNEWIVSWIAHQLPRAPLSLYDANIFHPEPRTLAFSEPLLVPSLLGAPLRWAGASPVLTYNLLLLVGLWTTGLAGFWVAWRFTGDALAGLLGGCLLAFHPQTLTRLPHLQAHYAAFFPLALFFFDRLLGGGRRRDAVLLGGCVALLSLTSGYWSALAAAALGAALLARPLELVRDWRRVLPALGLSVLVAAALALPPLLPYWRAHREQGLSRSLEEASSFASEPSNYLATPARVHFDAWSQRYFGSRGGAFFPGFTALALALLAGAGHGWRSPRVRMLAAIALVGFLLSLGPRTPAYAALHALFPPMKALRDPSRFGYLVLLSVGLLAPFGLAWLRRRGGRRGARGTLLAALAVAAVNVEALVAPMSYTPFDGLSPIYARVAAAPADSVLAEFPFYGPAEIYRNAEYVLASTAHWRPLVNGYSGFVPAAFAGRAQRLAGFPDDTALAELRSLGVTHVSVHLARYRAPRALALEQSVKARPELELLETGPYGERLYTFRKAAP